MRALLAPLALSAAAALAPTPAAQGPVKLATLVPEGSLWDKSFRRMGAEWKKATGGRISLRVYPGGVAGDEPDILRKMRIGQLHAASLTASGLADLDPAFRIFTVPLFFESDAELAYVIERMTPTLSRILEEKGFVLVHWGHVGWLHFFSTDPIHSYGDFEGMKQFVWGGDGLMAKWYEERGLRTVPLAATDVLTGLQTGLIQVMPVSPLVSLSLQWFRSAPYMLDYPISPIVGATIFSERAWKRLKEEDRKAILKVGKATGAELFETVPAQEVVALEEMKKRGLTVTPLGGGQDEERWQELAAHFRDRVGSAIPEDVFDETLRYVQEFRSQSAEDDG